MPLAPRDPLSGDHAIWTQASRALRLPVFGAILSLAACQPGVLDPAGPVAAAERTILIDSLAIMLAIVVPTIVLTVGFAWWYRSTNTKAKYLPDFAYSGQLEMIVWGVPVLTIGLLGGVAWVSSHDLDPAQPLVSKIPPLDVQVVSLDWKWLFIYPAQNVASVNRLVIPAGQPIHFTLTSASVMNAFFIPQLGSMIYTMNGMSDQLNLQADQPGTYHGLSSHYSGDGFSDMHFEVQAMSGAGFTGWVDGARAAGPKLDKASYGELSKQSSKVAPFTFQAADPDLFQDIVMQAVPAGPGPVQESNPGALNRAEK